MQWLAHWTSDLKVGSLRFSPCHCVVSLDKKLYPTLSLFTQEYKMGTRDILLRVTLRCVCGPLWLVCDFILFLIQACGNFYFPSSDRFPDNCVITLQFWQTWHIYFLCISTQLFDNRFCNPLKIPETLASVVIQCS